MNENVEQRRLTDDQRREILQRASFGVAYCFLKEVCRSAGLDPDDHSMSFDRSPMAKAADAIMMQYEEVGENLYPKEDSYYVKKMGETVEDARSYLPEFAIKLNEELMRDAGVDKTTLRVLSDEEIDLWLAEQIGTE